MKRAKLLLAVLSVLVVSSCISVDARPGWNLVWSDEFTASGSVDPLKWTVIESYPGKVNNEKQAYVDRPENVRVEDGKLIIEARNDKPGSYTSGRLDTFLSGKWVYGRIEVKAKLPAGVGTWPAIFMLATQNINNSMGWPSSGEIDIMEHVGFNPGYIKGSVHCAKYYHVLKNQKDADFVVEDFSSEFHVYAIEWFPDRIDYFVDDQKYFTYTNEKTGWEAWPFYRPFYLILNLAIGGDWGGMEGIDDTIFPARMEVDYVRVYQTDLVKRGYDPSEIGKP